MNKSILTKREKEVFELLIKNSTTIEIAKELGISEKTVSKATIYLLDNNNYLNRSKIVINNKDITFKAKELLEILIEDNDGENKIPSGFKAIIPSETKINSLTYDKNLIKVDFSKELLNTKKEYEEKIIEAIVYTLTSIEEVKNVIIYVEGEILTKLPQTKINLPNTLNRSFGINKEYNLMSFLNNNTKLLATEKELDTFFLIFNHYIFSNYNIKNILEEVIYTISLSVKDNYDVENIVFKADDKEIYKSVIKILENN